MKAERTYLQPKRCTLANCGQLRRLKVRKAQGGQVAILTRERGEAVDYDREFLEDEGESSTDEDEVRVATIMRLKISKAQQLHGLRDYAHSVT